MKKIGIMSVMLVLLLAVGVSAVDSTGFTFEKHVEVKGDWEWTGSWQKTYPTTAVYDYSVVSPESTWSDMYNDDNLGTPWQWEGHTRIESNKETDYISDFRVWTVNDPATTPATGGYTAYSFYEHTQSTNPDALSFVNVNVNGYGATWISSHVHTTEGSWQVVGTTIN